MLAVCNRLTRWSFKTRFVTALDSVQSYKITWYIPRLYEHLVERQKSMNSNCINNPLCGIYLNEGRPIPGWDLSMNSNCINNPLCGLYLNEGKHIPGWDFKIILSGSSWIQFFNATSYIFQTLSCMLQV